LIFVFCSGNAVPPSITSSKLSSPHSPTHTAGGSNNHNYANVKLIVDIARRTGADAVWAGWGHASENPRLPDALAAAALDTDADEGETLSAAPVVNEAIASVAVPLAGGDKPPKQAPIWIGPPSSAMRALGDKIGSTLIAQSANVPCVPWSGSGLHVKYDRSNPDFDPAVYRRACVTTPEEARASADRIGYPVMFKASEVRNLASSFFFSSLCLSLSFAFC
jgi:acetyl-CoA carboxylase/biotin carboxylase 1